LTGLLSIRSGPPDDPSRLAEEPTNFPTQFPTLYPTTRPSFVPTLFPSKLPTRFPTTRPTRLPTAKSCLVGSWEPWENCTILHGISDCGTGVEYRKRPIVQPADPGGRPCPNLVEARNCSRGLTLGMQWEPYNLPSYKNFLLFLTGAWGLTGATGVFSAWNLFTYRFRPNIAVLSWLTLGVAGGARAASTLSVWWYSERTGVWPSCVEVGRCVCYQRGSFSAQDR
jgi:hypothetical protein